MLGLTDYVIVIVINSLNSDDKKQTNYFSITTNNRTAALKSIYIDNKGNQHNRSNIQKQAYESKYVKIVRQAYGITGTKYSTHTPYKNGKQISLDDKVNKFDEIVLIKNNMNIKRATNTSNIHRILPERKGS